MKLRNRIMAAVSEPGLSWMDVLAFSILSSAYRDFDSRYGGWSYAGASLLALVIVSLMLCPFWLAKYRYWQWGPRKSKVASRACR